MQVFIIIFAIAILVQVVYFIFFLIAFTKEENRKSEARFDKPAIPVSVIICAHDEEENLRTLIPSLLAQDYPDFEIIIVDDRSNDNTYDYLLELMKQEPKVRMVRVQQKPERMNAKKYALTLGIKAAKYDWVLLTDADCRPQTNKWISAMSHSMDDSVNFVLGYSPYEKRPGILNLFIRFDTLLTALQYLGFTMLKNPYMGVGRNMAYRKSLFLNNKGFNGYQEVTGGDDDLFVNQHGTGSNTVVSLGNDTLMNSKPKETIGSFFNQKVRHLSVGKYYRASSKFLVGLFTLSLIITWAVGIPLVILSADWLWIVIALFVRVTLFSVTINVASSRLANKFESWAVPLLDFVFAIYYISTAPVALLTKKVQWKT